MRDRAGKDEGTCWLPELPSPPSPRGSPAGVPAGGAPSSGPSVRARLQPAPGTGLAAPPPRLLGGSAGGRRAQGAELSRAPRSPPRPGARPASAHAAQPLAVSSARAAGLDGSRGWGAGHCLSSIWSFCGLRVVAAPGGQSALCYLGVPPKLGTLVSETGWEDGQRPGIWAREWKQPCIKLGPLKGDQSPVGERQAQPLWAHTSSSPPRPRRLLPAK